MRILPSDKIQSTLGLLNITPRPLASPGPWLLFLLPVAVILGAYKATDLSNLYHISAVLCATLTGSAVIFLWNIYWSDVKSIANLNAGMVIPAALTSISLYILCGKGFIFSVFFGWLSSFGLISVTTALMEECPRCFTFGEACLVTQVTTLFSFVTAENICNTWAKPPSTSLDIATVILQVGLLGVAVICGTVYFLPALHDALPFYSLVAAVFFLGVIPVAWILTRRNPVLWILELVISDLTTVQLVMYWVVCCAVAVAVVTYQIKVQQQASTSVRKCFHILAVVVYIPGLVKACCLLYLASGVVLAVFIILELMRVLHIPPLGTALQEGFAVYADEKDAGNLALTPLYLLAGCSLPLWLHPVTCPSATCLLPLVSGLLAIGVGDTLASVAGTRLGRNKWAGSNKTIEGTIACIISQILVIFMLMALGLLDSSLHAVMKIFIAVIITSLVEAKTDQVDNLVLPLVTYIALL